MPSSATSLKNLLYAGTLLVLRFPHQIRFSATWRSYSSRLYAQTRVSLGQISSPVNGWMIG